MVSFQDTSLAQHTEFGMYNMYVNTLLVRKHMIISTDTEIPFDKKTSTSLQENRQNEMRSFIYKGNLPLTNYIIT